MIHANTNTQTHRKLFPRIEMVFLLINAFVNYVIKQSMQESFIEIAAGWNP